MGASQRGILRVIFLMVVVLLPGLATPGEGGEPKDVGAAVQASRYVFVPEQSTIGQTGGFAGVNWTYAVEGQFCLSVDPNGGSAEFTQVDAHAVDASEPARALDPNQVFNLTDLASTVLGEAAILLTGRAADGSTVLLTVTFEEDVVYLTGETIPPPDSADFFVFSIDALAARKYAGGCGEPNDPYQIATPEQMNAIGADPNDWDKHFILTADIDLSQFDGREGRPVFNVIGSDTDPGYGFRGTPFAGTFDGGDHAIANFSYYCQSADHIGLFGYVGGPEAEIRNLTLIDPNVVADRGTNVGALAGALTEGTVRRCHVEAGSVSAYIQLGGLVGWVGGAGTVTNCSSITTISGTKRVGGLVGWNGGSVANCCVVANVLGEERVGCLAGENQGIGGGIFKCYSAGDTAGGAIVGGLAGSNGSTVRDCYSTAHVVAESHVGGLVGSNFVGRGAQYGSPSVIVNCYSTGRVSGSAYTGGMVGSNSAGITNSFWDTETSGWITSAGGQGRTTIEMRSGSTFLGWNACGNEGTWSIDEGNDYPKLHWEERPGQTLAAAQLADFLTGSGTEDSPFLIYTADDLNLVGVFPCEWNKHFQLMVDIDMSEFVGGTYNIIGTYSLPFTGLFDGNNHTINHLSHDSIDTGYVGCFGYIADPNAQITNLGLMAPEIGATGGDHVGALVGHLEDGTIRACFVEKGWISGEEATGGLIGSNSDGSIIDCRGNAVVSGFMSTGGLVGRNRGGTITDCYATGTVSGTDRIGGLLGHNWYGTLRGSAAYADTKGSLWAGGLVGRSEWFATIANCRAGGSVGGEQGTGGLVGLNDRTSHVAESHASGVVNGNVDVGGLVGLSTGDILGCYATGSVSGEEMVGGLAGRSTQIVRDSYAAGTVRGGHCVGGLVGFLGGTILDCYASGTILGELETGGLVGSVAFTSDRVFASVWDIEASGEETSAAGIGLTTAEMQMASTFLEAGWDFVGEVENGTEDIWWIDEGRGYPRLWWEVGAEASP